MIPFNVPPVLGTEMLYIREAIEVQKKLSGDGYFSKKCQRWLETSFNIPKALLTPSCTAALEMAALLIDIQPGDEVIMPSYTFVSTANAFVLRGARIIFVDICPENMNIDPAKIEAAITNKTKAIVVVHYAGVGCAMDPIMDIASRYSLYVIEDAAQALMGFYRQRQLGSIGHLGCFSFHETKNYTSGGEGGALLINDERFIERAEILREKGTNRSQFLRGQVDKYTWRDLGSSYLASELQTAYLLTQLEAAEEINNQRLSIWNEYHNAFQPLEEQGLIKRPNPSEECIHNAHMYYFKFASLDLRTEFISKMREAGVQTAFHYIPLHTSPAGLKYGRFHGEDQFTTCESECLVRLPLWYNMTKNQTEQVIANTFNCLSTKV
jgi:dTDP-4-amino-4,6-dideoxygalactose transaminase